MNIKSILSACIAISLVTSITIEYSSGLVNGTTVSTIVESEDKISEELATVLAETTSETIPVALWYDEVEHSKVEACIKEEIGYNLATLEADYIAPSEDLISELEAAANGDASAYLDSLMENHLEITAAARAEEKEKTDRYKATRRQIISDMYTARAQSLIEDLSLSEEDILFVSKYTPMIICDLSTDEISSAAINSDINELSCYVPLEIEVCNSESCEINTGTTKNTVGINQINNLINLTGEGVTIGIYESCTVSSEFTDKFGLDDSQVVVIGEEVYTGKDHSTYCAGIAAGCNGVAPGATIHSASTESDWDSYQDKGFVEALPNLEDLIESDVDIVSVSWGFGNSTTYYETWAKYMDYLISNTCTTIVCATGNSYDSDILTPSSAYNTIAVNGFIDSCDGQVGNFLNDYSYKNGNGCLKPDVVGPSLNNGTSTATPYIAGMMALMFEYKPSLAVSPELTKAILMASCHEKCEKELVNSVIRDVNEPMTAGLTERQGAGIPNMYRMISIVSQHTYGNGVLDSSNGYLNEVRFVQPTYNSENINISMAYLQTNVSTSSPATTADNYEMFAVNNGVTKYSYNENSSTEMIYGALTSDPNYSLYIYKDSGTMTEVRYGYAWSTDNERYYNNYGDEGTYYLKNLKSSYYLSRNTSSNKAYQTSSTSTLDSLWVLDCTSSSNNTYTLKNANISSNGLGLGKSISSTNYYAFEGSSASVNNINVEYDVETGTYTFTRTVNGTIYALGINGNSSSSGACANWSPYSETNTSQKWYLETANYRTCDVNYNGTISDEDRTLLLNYLVNTASLNNLQKYLADANKDNSLNVADSTVIQQICLEN